LEYSLRSLANPNFKPKQRPTEDVADLRHRSMMDAIAPYAKKVQQSNMTPVYLNYKTRNTKLVLVLCPEWAPEMPPFNLARLSGIAKTAGYETKIIDLNIRAHNEFVSAWHPKKMLPFRLWDSTSSWHWLGNTYLETIHPVLEPLLLQACDEIEEINPDIVGFSVYYISEEPTKWMCQELKRRMPHLKIAVGGSNVQKSWFQIQPYYDYVVNGEGELALLKILEEVENKIEHSEPQYISQPVDQRININGLPMPDYESIDFSQYKIPNGVNSEISRGCTAKCTFCEETHFWKYRQRQAVDLITEIEWLYYNKGTDVIWFIDSLVNGNLKELRAFCKAVDAKGLKIHWTGYARCDGRMDLEYFKDLKKGGCIVLNYGIESGSQKVLDDMDKGVTIAEMEQNFKDGKEVGIWASTNWIIGFPTEDKQDFADSMTFLWRNRNNNINNVGAGVGFGLGPETIVGQNPDKFNLLYHKYHGHWITKDFKKGGTHVMTRVKSFYTFLDMILGLCDHKFGYPIRDSLPGRHYNIMFLNPKKANYVDYEKFNYDIIKPNINPFADSLVNEIWPLLRILWKTRGGYFAEIKFNPDIDLMEFGTQYGPGLYTADIKFIIDDEGKWQADFKYDFNQHMRNPDEDHKSREKEREGPFYAQDYSRIQSNTATRARRLAKPNWSIDTGRDNTQFGDLLKEELFLNQTIDFSFKHHYKGTGDWSNYQDFKVEVSTKSSGQLPEKEMMFAIPIDKIGFKKNET